MSTEDKKTYDMLQKVLKAIKLPAETEKLAEEYLDTTQPENRSLLDKVLHQDFTKLDLHGREASADYIRHLDNQGMTEELARYVRFCGAVGGSTVYYIFPWGSPEALHLRIHIFNEFLTVEQYVANLAEDITDDRDLTWKDLDWLWSKCGQDSQVLRGAMEFCYGEDAKTKMLLAALFLHFTDADHSKGEDGNEISQVVTFLEESLISMAPDVYQDEQKLTDEECGKLKKFLRSAKADAAFPEELPRVPHNGTFIDQPTSLLYQMAKTAFLALDHSDHFLLLVRFAIYAEHLTALDICKRICSEKLLDSRLKLLEQNLPVSLEKYGNWCVSNELAKPLQRMAKSHEDVVISLAEQLTITEYQFLLSQVKKVNSSLAQRLNEKYSQDIREGMADWLTDQYSVGGDEARDYLLGKAELKQLYPFIEEWRKNIWDFYDPMSREHLLPLRDGEDVPMFRRAVVLEALGCRYNYFYEWQVYDAGQGAIKDLKKAYSYKLDKKGIDQKQLQAMFDIFEQEAVPAVYQLDIMAAIYDSFYEEDLKADFMDKCVDLAILRKDAWAEEFSDILSNGTVGSRLICVRVLSDRPDEYKELLLSCAGDASQRVRELLADVCAGHKEWESEVIALLVSKKIRERETAVLVLEKWGAESYKEPLEKAFKGEKNKKLRERLATLLSTGDGADGQGQPGLESAEEERWNQLANLTVEELVAELTKGNRKKKVEWTLTMTWPDIHKLDGTECPKDYVLAFLLAYANMETPGVNKAAAKLAAELNPTELAHFMKTLFFWWAHLGKGADVTKKWVLYAAVIHGGDIIVPVIYRQIQDWPGVSRTAMAAEAIRVLALSSSPTALLTVDEIFHKYNNQRMKNAADETLDDAAKQLGITREELEDKIVPDLDFDERGERIFDYGTRTFRVKLTPELKLEIYGENGKKLKSMPAPGEKDHWSMARDANENFKQMKAQLKTVVNNQTQRLEKALSANRLWRADKWQELFVKNPIMHQFAIGLVWGVYEKEGPEMDGSASGSASIGRKNMLRDTFRYMEDGSFNTVGEEEYLLPEGAMIGLVHPIELSEEALAAWKEQFSNYEVTQPFEQLERSVYSITEDEKNEKELTRFGGVVVNNLSLSGKLLGQGWRRGVAEDMGIFYFFHRIDGEYCVELQFSGMPSYGYEEQDVTLYSAWFFPAAQVEDSYWVSNNYNVALEYRKKRCLLSEVDPRYFSEIVLYLTRAAASSKKKLKYPECKDDQ